MRTTLAIDDDLLSYAKSTAARERSSVGAVISRLVRSAIDARHGEGGGENDERNGVPLLPRRTLPQPITMEFVNQLRDEAP